MPQDHDLVIQLNETIKDIKASLVRIETQTSKTNGRVNKLENWRYFITGALALIGVVLIPIATIAIQTYYSQTQELKATVVDSTKWNTQVSFNYKGKLNKKNA